MSTLREGNSTSRQLASAHTEYIPEAMGEEKKDKGASHTVSTTSRLTGREDTAHHKRLRSVICTDTPCVY